MIKKVQIKNFKTLKDLAFPCKRMNLFIGDTSTGKSNILEALTLFSRGVVANSKFDQRLIRYDNIEDLFPLRDVSEPMVVDIGTMRLTLAFERGQFKLDVRHLQEKQPKANDVRPMDLQPNGVVLNNNNFQFLTTVRRYMYLPDLAFGMNTAKEMEPPFGANLPGLLASNKQLRTRVSKILEGTGVQLEVSLQDNAIRLRQTTDENVVVTLPYGNLSDTIKRYLFMYAILETVKGYTLLFDEPEQNTFPFYTKHMAEMMALDNGNQYFITTHNEYLFRSVVEKTPAKDLTVSISYLDAEGFTCLKRLTAKELAQLLDSDIFFNLDRYLPE